MEKKVNLSKRHGTVSEIPTTEEQQRVQERVQLRFSDKLVLVIPPRTLDI